MNGCVFLCPTLVTQSVQTGTDIVVYSLYHKDIVPRALGS